jgi:2,4-dienoyl-CoA reductase-like NADH-dependent reductase (Old Yellow Enzyme family)
MPKYLLLSAPLNIGNLVLTNRIVMPPMVIFMAENDGLVIKAHIEHYRSSTGPGLMIVEGTAVLPEGRINRRQLGIFNDHHIDGLSQLAKTIHAGGAVAGIQIHHAGATAFKETGKRGIKRLASVLVRLGRQQFTTSGLRRIREAFGAATRRAVEAGFDIIEIHGAHGYLFSQFLSPLKNWRIDRYGGKLENRRRLLLEVYQEVHSKAAGRALATVRLGVADGHRGGLILADGLSTASALEKGGAELLDISSGSGTPPSIRPEGSPYSSRLHLARGAKQALSIPVIGGGGVRHPDLAEKALQEGMADLIYVGKGMLADPAWARKTIEGRPETIVPCLACGTCFFYSGLTKCPARKKRRGDQLEITPDAHEEEA